jgi:hypothetical protein
MLNASQPSVQPKRFSRRQCVQSLGGGLGCVTLAGLLAETSAQAASDGLRGVHFRPRAKRVIQLFMNGGPFQADLFDPKPALNKFAGQRPAEVDLRTERQTGGLMAVPTGFRNCGESGLPISELLPKLQQHADELCVVRSCHTDNPNHGPALFLMNNGSMTPIRPSMGAWLTYGLGSENDDLPGYVVLCPGRPVRFAELWSSGFLPGEHQGLYINSSQTDPLQMVPNVKHAQPPAQQRRQLDLLAQLNGQHAESRGGDSRFDARMRAMETAYRMQFAASEAFDIRRESVATRTQYGASQFSNACLLARRLVERGVRFVQIYYGNGQPWDTHGNHNASVRKLCDDIDRPTAALLTDLKQRGLLEDTLVVWGGEFGRTSTSEGGDGRDHNHWGFSMWLAGGGVRGGTAYGATDDFGFRAVHNKVHIHDLHATVLHLLGLDHERLTYRHAGRDFRLTDVHGRVVREIIA